MSSSSLPMSSFAPARVGALLEAMKRMTPEQLRRFGEMGRGVIRSATADSLSTQMKLALYGHQLCVEESKELPGQTKVMLRSSSTEVAEVWPQYEILIEEEAAYHLVQRPDVSMETSTAHLIMSIVDDPVFKGDLSLVRKFLAEDVKLVGATPLPVPLSCIRDIQPHLLPLLSPEQKKTQSLTCLVEIWQRVSANVFGLVVPLHGCVPRGAQMGKALFTGLATRLNHSCSPNCDYFFTKPDFKGQTKIHVYATRDIKVGEELTISYSINIPYSRKPGDRSEFILRKCGFTCQCTRCREEMTMSSIMESRWASASSLPSPVLDVIVESARTRMNQVDGLLKENLPFKSADLTRFLSEKLKCTTLILFTYMGSDSSVDKWTQDADRLVFCLPWWVEWVNQLLCLENMSVVLRQLKQDAPVLQQGSSILQFFKDHHQHLQFSPHDRFGLFLVFKSEEITTVGGKGRLNAEEIAALQTSNYKLVCTDLCAFMRTGNEPSLPAHEHRVVELLWKWLEMQQRASLNGNSHLTHAIHTAVTQLFYEASGYRKRLLQVAGGSESSPPSPPSPSPPHS